MRSWLFITLSAFALRAEGQDTLATISRALYGDLAVVVQVRPNQVRLAVDNGTHNLFLSFVGSDVRRWSDSTLRLLSRAPGRAGWRSAVHEPGMRSGTASLSVRREGKEAVYTLFFADDSLRTVRGPLAPAEARAFARTLRRASDMALGGPRRRQTR